MDSTSNYLQVEIDKVEAKIVETKKLLGTDLDEEANKEISELEKQKAELEKHRVTEMHRHKAVEKTENFNNIIMEVRPGVGGDEAKIWMDDLIRMYTRYAEIRGWKVETIDAGVIKIKGKNIFSKLKWETGVHRVQRVPETEASGRIHTSTASVVILPEVPENLIEIKEDDLGWEFTRAGGHGGQNVNKVSSAVRLTYKPTGLVISCRQERSQEQNRKVALEMLRGELWQIEQDKQQEATRVQRSAIGRSMRSEKIRTFNYPQNRVTDHRLGKSWYQLDTIIEGRLDDVVEALAAFDFSQADTNNNNDTADDSE